MLPSLTSFTVLGLVGQESDLKRLQIGESGDYNTGITRNGMGKGPHSLSSPLDEYGSKRAGVLKASSGNTLPSKSLSITNLEFVLGQVSATLLGRVLTLPIALERFQYEMAGVFSPSKFFPGLLTQVNSLKELVINTQYASHIDRENLTIGSLAELRSLERLVVPIGMLLEFPHLSSDVNPAQNPLDTLLPPFLVTLDLGISTGGFYALVNILNILGIPKTLPTTALHIPTLRQVIIDRGIYGNSLQVQEAAIVEASRICPQITLEFREVRSAHF